MYLLSAVSKEGMFSGIFRLVDVGVVVAGVQLVSVLDFGVLRVFLESGVLFQKGFIGKKKKVKK